MTAQFHSGRGHNISAGTVYIDSNPKLTSDLATVANILGKQLFLPNETNDCISQAFSPALKISHNNVVRFRPIIDNYKSYVGKVYAIYAEFDSQGTNKTHIILENIKLCYLKEKAALLMDHPDRDEISVIRESADNLIDAVESALLNQIKTSSNLEISSEAISLSLQIILIDAFIRCKILEEPPNAAS